MTRSHATSNFRDIKNHAIIAFDRRAVPRRRVLKEALVVFNKGQSTLSCLVTDISENGARLRMPFSTALPRRFVLLIKSDGVARPVLHVWSTLREVGVRFIQNRATLG